MIPQHESPLEKLALVINRNKPRSSELAGKLRSICKAHATEVEAVDTWPLTPDFLKEADAVCTLGGDGTLLSVVPAALQHKTPVFGVNQGKLGFLAAYSEEKIQEELPAVLQGHYQITRRSLLNCQSKNQTITPALNDIVIKSAATGLVELKVFCDGQWVNNYNCDGLVFATPTGSTAYNLSAGGPIIHAGTQTLTLTPVCPHTLSNRSIIFSEKARLGVELPHQAEVRVTLDGRTLALRNEDFPLSINISTEKLPLLLPPKYSSFSTLRAKLDWGQSP